MSKNMADIFTKLTDLKNIFQFAEKIVPIIQNLIEFMQEMTPLLENINSSISDSTSQMKQGTDQIADVTSANELATTEILDLVDEISNKLFEVDAWIKKEHENYQIQRNLIKELKETGDKNVVEIADKLEKTIEKPENSQEMVDILATVNEDAYKITLSLQVQDITAQQLASVNHLIASVQSRLSSLISDIDKTHITEDVETLKIIAPDGATFDPNASYTKKEGKQESVDDIINDEKKRASQDEIDKLFS